MPRAHLSKRLPDADAIRLFAEHHIVHVRRRKNGEIVAVKHATFGWMSPSTYYGMQKLHDLMPLLQEFIRGGYQAKAWLWSTTIDFAGVSLPLGGILPLLETQNLLLEAYREPKNPAMLALRLYALIGPWGDILQIIDTLHAIAAITPPTGPGGLPITPGGPTGVGGIIQDFVNWLLTRGAPTAAGSPTGPGPIARPGGPILLP